MLKCQANHIFRNWAQTLKFRPKRLCMPETEADVVALVKEAGNQGKTVRTQGAGHSFSQLLATDDTLVSLDDMPTAVSVNGKLATVSAGIRLKDLIVELKNRGLALKNLGSITEQSIAGATSTGTHGSGLRLGSISTQIEEVRLVAGTGGIRTVKRSDGDLLDAASLGLGLLGIQTEVTLECVDHYQLEYNAYVTTFDHVLPHIDQLNQENVRVVLWWFLPPVGSRNCVILITKNPPGHPKGMLGNATDALPVLVTNLLGALPMDAEQLLGTFVLGAGPPQPGFKRIWTMTGDYDEILTLPLLPIFHRECEYAIPVRHTADALREMRKFLDEGDFTLRLPVEVRFVAADSALLSPANGRDVCYIGASTLDNATEVFERFEPLMKELEGRPHWGKNFTLTSEEVEGLYGAGYSRFKQIRRDFDPDGVFLNSFLADYFE